jgi:hypothetical protein
MSRISDLWTEKVPQPVRMLVYLAAGVLVLLFCLFVLPNWWQRASNAVWHSGTNEQRQEISADKAEAEKWKTEAEKWKTTAAGALGELKQTKLAYAEETRKREELEKILANEHLATGKARDTYDRVLAQPAPTPDYGASTDDLCEQARRLGVPCQ